MSDARPTLGELLTAAEAEAVRNVIARELGLEIGKVRDDDRLADDLHADSIDRADIAIELEKEFDIGIHDEIAGAWKTVGDVIATVEQAPAR